MPAYPIISLSPSAVFRMDGKDITDEEALRLWRENVGYWSRDACRQVLALIEEKGDLPG